MTSDAQKKAAAARRSREYRERKRREQAGGGDSSDTPAQGERDAAERHAPAGIAAAVETALQAMKWLAPSDGGAVALVRHSARRIDTLVARQDDKLEGRISQEEQTLIRLLHEIGGTPTVRMQHELRSMRLSHPTPEASDDRTDDEAPKQRAEGGTVTAFERPARRR